MASGTDFEDIYMQLSPNAGKLRLAANGLGWKAYEGSEKPTTVAGDTIRYAEWCRVARNFQLKIATTRGEQKFMTFDGFTRDDFDRITNLLKNNYDVTVDSKDISLRGWNWGKADLQSNNMSFMIAGKQAFSVPIQSVHNTSINKQEVAVEFKPDAFSSGQPSKKSKGVADELVELRLYVPGSEAGARKRAKKAAKEAELDADGKPVKKEDGDEEDDEDEEMEGEEGEQSAAQVFHDALKERAEIGQVTGDAMVTFAEVACVTPRGKYDIELYNGFFRLRNKSYDYKVLYPSVKRVFMLPKNDEINVQLVVNLDPPIRQGQTRYPYLVMQFAKEEVMEAELNLDDEETKTSFPELEPKYEDAAYNVVSTVLKAVTGKKAVSPSANFSSADGQSAIKCNLRANEGQLYFLDKYMLFISKQPVLVSYADVSVARFERVSSAMSASRTVDMKLELRADSDISFSAINKEEHAQIADFLADKKIKVKNEIMEEMIGTAQAVTQALMEEDDDDESEAESDDSRKDERKKMKKQKEKAVQSNTMDLDEDSEVDEDFAAPGSDSDVAEEFDEDYSSAGSDAEASPEKPKKKKKAADEGDSERPKKKSKKSKDD